MLPGQFPVREQLIISISCFIKYRHIMCQRRFRIIIRRMSPIFRIPDAGMGQKVIFLIHDSPLPADEQQCIIVVEHPDFIRHQKFPPALLEVRGIAAGASFGLPVGVGIYSLFSKQLRYIFVRLLFVAAKV